MSQQKTFVDLVNKGAQPKAYMRQLGMSLEDVRKEMTYLDGYRKNIELAEKIADIRKSNLTKPLQEKEIKKVRKKNETDKV